MRGATIHKEGDDGKQPMAGRRTDRCMPNQAGGQRQRQSDGETETETETERETQRQRQRERERQT